MKKRKLISFLMVLCMLAVTVLASCESGAGVDDITHRKAATLVMAYIVEDSTTPEAIAAVQAALSHITENLFTTRIKLMALKKSEYEAAIERSFAAYDAEIGRQLELESIRKSSERASRDQAKLDRDAGIPTVRTQKPTEPPRTTALYTERIVWPETTTDQIDIFLTISPEMFVNLVTENRLAPLNDELGTKAKILKEYIHPSILAVGEYNGSMYAIPTNKAIGQATYLAINKRLAEQYELDLTKVRDWRDLTAWLEAVKANEPSVAMVEGGPLYPLTFEPMFPEFENFPVQATAGKSLVYTPEQPPTEPRTQAPTEPPTDEAGNLIPTEEPTETTIPPTTLPPKSTPAVTNNTPDTVAVSNIYTGSVWTAYAQLNDEWRAKGLFTSNVAAGSERAVYQFTGTLEDKITQEAADLADGYEYEYLMMVNPRATREELQKAMFAVSVATANVTRAMEVVTLLNTNPEFKNIFTYGVDGEHFIYNDHKQIERLNNDYMVNTDYTGNHFIADLLDGENPAKWEIAKEHNLNVVNSVFLKFYFDQTKLSAESLASLDAINKVGQEVRQAYLNGLPARPADYEGEAWNWDAYIFDVVTPAFEAAGTPALVTNIREQTSPEA